MKKLINQPDRVVEEMLEGLLCSHAGWVKLEGCNVLLRADFESAREHHVAIISGGGSGHEPAHSGYVGAGMLSAAVAGEVFTSPSVQSVLAAIRHVAGKPGVLLIVKNYTGDRLNFGLAAEMARQEGIRAETVIVEDDVALAATEQTAGRRGLAGTVLVHKVAGAAASEGSDLAAVALVARATARDVATMGVSFSAGTIPGVDKPTYILGEAEMELGLGIHGEPGIRRMPVEHADAVATRLVDAIVSAHSLQAGERVAVLINNLGATSNMELAIFARGVLRSLLASRLVVERVYSGTFLSSLDTAGVSLSLLRVDDDRLSLLDAPTAAPAWSGSTFAPGEVEGRVVRSVREPVRNLQSSNSVTAHASRAAIEAVCVALKENEARFNELDRRTGDGDLGTSLTRGANAIQAATPYLPLHKPAETLKAIAFTVQDAMGGSSGPLYSILLLRAAESLSGSNPEDLKDWATALLAGCDGVSELGGARAGDRTMLDAFRPFGQTLKDDLQSGYSQPEALEAAVKRAESAAEETANMLARRGRSSYLAGRELGSPDPGAVAAAVWLRALVSWFLNAKFAHSE